jgi:hypothetical protein
MRLITLKRPVMLQAYRLGDPTEPFITHAKAVVVREPATTGSGDNYDCVYAFGPSDVRHTVALPARSYMDFYRVELDRLGGGNREVAERRAQQAFGADSNLTAIPLTIPASNIDAIAVLPDGQVPE